MKNTNKIYSLIMTTLLLTLSMLTGVMADDVIIPDEVINYIELVVGEDEISAEAIIADESNEELMSLSSRMCIVNGGRGYPSYSAFVYAEGSAGSGYEWHHIVEQC